MTTLYLELQFAGWYNFPMELVVGGAGGDQVLVSAIGAMNDTGTLRCFYRAVLDFVSCFVCAHPYSSLVLILWCYFAITGLEW